MFYKYTNNYSITFQSIREGDAPINQAYERMEAIDCPKCIFWDYQEALCDKNYCNPIDPDIGLPLMMDFDHLALIGVRKLRPILDKLARRALNLTLNDGI